jgi:hypothetical protein
VVLVTYVGVIAAILFVSRRVRVHFHVRRATRLHRTCFEHKQVLLEQLRSGKTLAPISQGERAALEDLVRLGLAVKNQEGYRITELGAAKPDERAPLASAPTRKSLPGEAY